MPRVLRLSRVKITRGSVKPCRFESDSYARGRRFFEKALLRAHGADKWDAERVKRVVRPRSWSRMELRTWKIVKRCSRATLTLSQGIIAVSFVLLGFNSTFFLLTAFSLLIMEAIRILETRRQATPGSETRRSRYLRNEKGFDLGNPTQRRFDAEEHIMRR